MGKYTNFHIIRLRRKSLEKLRDAGEKKDIEVVGMVYVDEDVDPELIKATISSTKIYGGILGSADTKATLHNLSTI